MQSEEAEGIMGSLGDGGDAPEALASLGTSQITNGHAPEFLKNIVPTTEAEVARTGGLDALQQAHVPAKASTEDASSAKYQTSSPSPASLQLPQFGTLGPDHQGSSHPNTNLEETSLESVEMATEKLNSSNGQPATSLPEPPASSCAEVSTASCADLLAGARYSPSTRTSIPSPPRQAESDALQPDANGTAKTRDGTKGHVAVESIDYDYDEVEGSRVLRLKPTREQWEDFPSVLAYARSLGAEGDGCFKVLIPDGLHGPLPDKPAEHVAANAYKVKLLRRSLFWQVSTVPSEGVFASAQPTNDFTESVEMALKNLKHLFRKQQNRQLRNIRYRVDVPAWTKTQRHLAGVPEKSPIYPLKGDKLEHTKAVIPGIHTPYVYESGPYFGATFQIHAEDFRLASLNHLYKGRKIWIVVPATAVDVAEAALGRGTSCSQFMRHRAEFFFPDKLQKLGIPYRIVDQRPGETIVILPDAYHEGFSCGYTIAEAKNYADTAWTTSSYQPCQAACMLATAIPAAFMRPLEDGEQRLDLCAAYGDGLSLPVTATHLPAAPPPLPTLQQHQQQTAERDSELTIHYTPPPPPTLQKQQQAAERNSEQTIHYTPPPTLQQQQQPAKRGLEQISASSGTLEVVESKRIRV
ncbi:Transcription factor jumonji [Moelleriella libera RCEF 2490]|uniref:Transcription factor jumonji n=1 Tax=Moelleriella libera RCEF 2490 TaxID=1081109 RepID=A0A162II47_9HYPO|nr:Transcription factor jumonji [Moelleriella libera RCEF 2490]